MLFSTKGPHCFLSSQKTSPWSSVHTDILGTLTFPLKGIRLTLRIADVYRFCRMKGEEIPIVKFRADHGVFQNSIFQGCTD